MAKSSGRFVSSGKDFETYKNKSEWQKSARLKGDKIIKSSGKSGRKASK